MENREALCDMGKRGQQPNPPSAGVDHATNAASCSVEGIEPDSKVGAGAAYTRAQEIEAIDGIQARTTAFGCPLLPAT
jgi:hypothetical protein